MQEEALSWEVRRVWFLRQIHGRPLGKLRWQLIYNFVVGLHLTKKKVMRSEEPSPAGRDRAVA